MEEEAERGTIRALGCVFKTVAFPNQDVRDRLTQWGFVLRVDPFVILFAQAQDSLLELPFLERRKFELRLREAGWGCLLPDAPPPKDSRALCARIAFTLCRTLRFLSLGLRESPNYLQKADAVFRAGRPLFERLSPEVPFAERIKKDIAYVEA